MFKDTRKSQNQLNGLVTWREVKEFGQKSALCPRWPWQPGVSWIPTLNKIKGHWNVLRERRTLFCLCCNMITVLTVLRQH